MNLRDEIKQVQEFIETIKDKNLMNRELAVADRFPDFWKNYPFLVKKLVKDNQDLGMLELMLSKIDKINNNETSMAAVEYDLGNKLADKYLKPVIDKENKEN
jgi:hypothetical protein